MSAWVSGDLSGGDLGGRAEDREVYEVAAGGEAVLCVEEDAGAVDVL